ncbi:MAG: hypothetical protein HFG48_01115 [Bacilli bacterium]|nr:hypothetical protein [Bacilli bacterium]
MKKSFDLSELKKYISDSQFSNGDRLYCLQFPNLIFIYELDNNPSIANFIGYYADSHDLFSDGSLSELLKDNNDYIFSKEPFINDESK